METPACGGPLEARNGQDSGVSPARRFGIAVVFLWFLIGGIAHFVATDAEMRIVPPYVPWPRAAVLVSRT